jgi:hypothetical protein
MMRLSNTIRTPDLRVVMRDMTVPRPDAQQAFGVGVVFTAIGIGYLVFVLVFCRSELWVQLAYRPVEADVVDRCWAEVHSVRGISHRLEALLAYHVDGQDYRTWVAWPQTARQQIGPEAEAVFSQVQPGQRVTCYYDPFDPATAVPARDMDLWGWDLTIAFLVPLLLSAVFSLVGVGVLAAAWPEQWQRIRCALICKEEAGGFNRRATTRGRTQGAASRYVPDRRRKR